MGGIPQGRDRKPKLLTSISKRSLGIGAVPQMGSADNSVSALGAPDGMLIDDDTEFGQDGPGESSRKPPLRSPVKNDRSRLPPPDDLLKSKQPSMIS